MKRKINNKPTTSTVFVTVFDGSTIYQCDKEYAQAEIPLSVWNSLDFAQQYKISNGKVEVLTPPKASP